MKTKLILFSLLLNVYCLAQNAGSLDTTFGVGGKVITSITNTDDRINAIVIQPDGKIVAGGAVHYFTDTADFCLVRYLENGDLDSTFGTNGFVVTNLTSGSDVIMDMKLQSDGKIVVAGGTNNGNDVDFALARYQTNGNLDSTFGVNGIQKTTISNGDDFAYSLQINNTTNSIYVGGVNNTNSLLVKYNASGMLDSTMNGTGIQYMNFGSNTIVFSIALQSDSRIICGGSLPGVFDWDYMIARFDTTGFIDSTFGNNGYTVTGISNYYDQIEAIKILPDDKIIVGGSADLGGSLIEDYALVKYDENGIIDSSFGINGIVGTNMGGEDEIYELAVQNDGKIIAAGLSFQSTNGVYFALARYTATGTLDSSFGNNGIVLTGDAFTYNVCYALAIQNDYKIIAGGAISPGLPMWNIALARYMSGLNVGMIDFTNQKTPMLAYPNPVKDYAYINYTLTNDESLTIKLYDMQGHEVKSFISDIEKQKGEQTEYLYFDDGIKTGIYFLQISNGKSVQAIKIVKN